MPAPSVLKIAESDDGKGFYLLYCDNLGREMNDSFFDSFADAKEQARWEFGVKLSDWLHSR